MPDTLPESYDLPLLELARQYENASGRYPFNPQMLDANSLEWFDLDFVASYEQYKAWVEYEKQEAKVSAQIEALG